MGSEKPREPKSTSYDLNGSNALLHHVPSLDAIGDYNLDDDLVVGSIHELSIDLCPIQNPDLQLIVNIRFSFPHNHQSPGRIVEPHGSY